MQKHTKTDFDPLTNDKNLRNVAKRCLAIGSLWACAIERHPETAEISSAQAEDEIIAILEWVADKYGNAPDSA
jgi:hypothetical protein